MLSKYAQFAFKFVPVIARPKSHVTSHCVPRFFEVNGTFRRVGLKGIIRITGHLCLSMHYLSTTKYCRILLATTDLRGEGTQCDVTNSFDGDNHETMRSKVHSTHAPILHACVVVELRFVTEPKKKKPSRKKSLCFGKPE